MSPDCEHFGKTSDELDAELGLTWILENCANCLTEQECYKESLPKCLDPFTGEPRSIHSIATKEEGTAHEQ